MGRPTPSGREIQEGEVVVLGLGSTYWQYRLSRWSPPKGSEEGYTLLLPVPGDLPVFLELAMVACANQDSKHRVATIVIPDKPTPEVNAIVAAHRPAWPDSLDVSLLPLPERWFLPRMRSGSRNHGLQLITGVQASQSTHIILHDADLFPRNPTLLDSQYEQCVERDLLCLGVSPVWDGWYGEHGLKLAATWELCAQTQWLRSFTPYRHIGHDGTLFGEQHTFDTTLYPQSLTSPQRIAVAPSLEDEFVHFNYVITTFRQFQRHGAGYLDDRYRLLFISLLTTLFGERRSAGALPDLPSLAAALGKPDAVVRHPSPDEGRASFGEFRGKLDLLLTAPWIDTDRASVATEALAVFDRYYALPGE